MSDRQKKIEAVLSAAVKWRNAVPSIGSNEDETLLDAVREYAALPPGPAASPTMEQLVASNGFTCPHCGVERPAYGWHWNMGDTGPFMLQWITCFCGECRQIISTTVVAFQPKQEMVEQLKREFAGKVNLA